MDRLDKEDEYELEEKKKSNILTAAAGEAISTVLTNKEREARRKREADKHRLRYLKHLKQAGLDIELVIIVTSKMILSNETKILIKAIFSRILIKVGRK